MSKSVPAPATSPTRMSRAFHLLLTGVIAIAFVGFFVGLRQGKTAPEPSPPQREHVAEYPQAIPATAWRDFDRRKYGPNRDWQNTLANLKQPAVDTTFVAASTSDRRTLQSVRANRRAFPGAPPVVPHPIDQMSTSSCMACHGEGLFIGKGVRAPKMSHTFLASCTQCHVELEAAELMPVDLAANQFEPAEVALTGHRAWPGAPPTIPHSTWMRESCLSCHGPTGRAAIRTSHPARANCLQCHAPSAVLDQVVTQDLPGWLGAANSQRSESQPP